MGRWVVFFLLGLFLRDHGAVAQDRTLSVAKQAAPERRIALVIGNARYPGAALRNPVNDARDVARMLRKLGFEVLEKTDVSQKEMNRAITQFGEKLDANSIALFFYAGHGLQVRGKNYLVPIDAQIASEASVRSETVDVDSLLEQLISSPLNVVILDACRNNPFERRFRSIGGGLAQMEAPKGTLIAYATAPGKVASDGNGRNGLYTHELLKQIESPGLPVEAIFKRVRAGVARATGDNQIPWESSSLTGDFFFKPPRGQAAGQALAEDSPAPQGQDRDMLFWKSIQGSSDAGDYEDYLLKYPEGEYASLAKRRIAGLRSAEATAPLATAASPLPDGPVSQERDELPGDPPRLTNLIAAYQRYRAPSPVVAGDLGPVDLVPPRQLPSYISGVAAQAVSSFTSDLFNALKEANLFSGGGGKPALLKVEIVAMDRTQPPFLSFDWTLAMSIRYLLLNPEGKVLLDQIITSRAIWNNGDPQKIAEAWDWMFRINANRFSARMGERMPPLARSPGKLYFYRESAFLEGAGVVMALNLDGQQVGTLTTGSYVAVDAQPGKRKISARRMDEYGKVECNHTIEVAPDSQHFVKVDLLWSVEGQCKLLPVNESGGLQEIGRLVKRN